MLPPQKQGSLNLLIQNQSQTRTFMGEVVEGNTVAGTCLVRISGSRVQTCDVAQGSHLDPGDKVMCTHLPGHVRLVATPMRVSQAENTYITNIIHNSSSGGDGGGVTPPALAPPSSLTAIVLPGDSFPTSSLLDNFNRSDEGPPPSASWTDAWWTGAHKLSVLSSQVHTTDSDWGGSLWDTVYGPDLEVFCTIGATPATLKTFMLYWRVQNSASYDNLYYSYIYNVPTTGGISFNINKLVSGNDTALYVATDTGLTIESGDSFGVSHIDDTIILYFKKAAGAWTVVTTVVDNAISGAGYLGLEFGNSSTITADDFGGGDGIVVEASGIELGWSAGGTGTTSYHIEKSLDGLSFIQLATVLVSQISYIDADLAAATQYWYRVRAVSATAVSNYSNVATATTS